MDTMSSCKAMLNQSVIVQLHLALKSLDILGKSVAAAHIDAAIQNLKDESISDNNTSRTDISLEPFDAKMDVSQEKYKLKLSHSSME